MKKMLCALLILGLFLSCDKDSGGNKNPFLPDYHFSVTINTSLPLYSGLRTPITPVFISIQNAGISGIIAMKISDSDYRAWEACCPSQYPVACSTMAIDGVNAKCSCESYTYSIFTGIGNGKYPMKAYRIVPDGDNLIIFN